MAMSKDIAVYLNMQLNFISKVQTLYLLLAVGTMRKVYESRDYLFLLARKEKICEKTHNDAKLTLN